MCDKELPIFAKSLEEAHVWINALMARLETRDQARAYHILRATLHALRDRIGPENAIHLSAQLPLIIRGLFFEGWRPTDTPTRERHLAGFLDSVSRELDENHRGEVQNAVHAVFMVIWQRIDQGEVAKLTRIFPEELRFLWQEPGAVSSTPAGHRPSTGPRSA